MKIQFALSTLLCGCVCAQTILFSDNFDAPDSANFDASPTDGRFSGILANDVVLRSWGIQQAIGGNQLSIPNRGNSGVRFENAAGPFGAGNRFDWAAGATGAAILESGGFTVSFDWTPPGTDTSDWISFQVGTVNADSGNLVNDDYGILFRRNGGTQRFNGALIGDGDPFTPTTSPITIEIKFELTSFADGEEVTATSSVEGSVVATDTFLWTDNGGEMRMELGSNDNGHLVDNLTIATNETAPFFVSIDNRDFASGQSMGSLIGTFDSVIMGNPASSTYTFVAGDGDIDNDKFQITGDGLEVGNFDFAGAGSINEQQYSVRVRAENDSGPESLESVYLLTVFKDDDSDTLLDDWELRWAADLTELSGLAGDLDADGLTDFQEYEISIGSFVGAPAFVDIDPTKADTDDDSLNDLEEVTPTLPRVQTNPTLADTDQDGLSDSVEDSTGVFTDVNSTGTNPNLVDTDLDGARDGWEIDQSSDPHDIADFPPSASPSVTVVQITDDLSSEISDTKTYTHAISGGAAVTVNGVSFEALTMDITPPNIVWDTGTFVKRNIIDNNGDWLPEIGGVTGTGVQELLNDFTYSGDGTRAGASQSFTLSNLTPGANYDLRLYVRLWDTDGSGRSIDLKFTNGEEVTIPFGAIPEDRPGIVLGSDNNQEAYFISYRYTAQQTEVEIEASIFEGIIGVSGSFHMYALTNEIASSLVPVITRTGFTSSGDYVMQFQGQPSTTFEVTKSLDIASGFAPLEPVLESTTDSTGGGQVIIPSFQASDAKAFFRLEPSRP